MLFLLTVDRLGLLAPFFYLGIQNKLSSLYLYQVALLSAQKLFLLNQLFILFIMNLRQEKLKNGGKQLMRQCYQVVDGMMR